MEDFERNKYGVSNHPPRNECTLVLWNDAGEACLEPICNNFRDQFIQNVTEPYRLEVADVIRVMLIWDQDNMRVVERWRDISSMKNIKHGLRDVCIHCWPNFLIKEGFKPVWPQGFTRLHLEECLRDLIRAVWLAQDIVSGVNNSWLDAPNDCVNVWHTIRRKKASVEVHHNSLQILGVGVQVPIPSFELCYMIYILPLAHPLMEPGRISIPIVKKICSRCLPP